MQTTKHNSDHSDHSDALLLKLDKYGATYTVGGLDNERIEPLRSEGAFKLGRHSGPPLR